MTTSEHRRRWFATTRGRVLAFLYRGPRTIAEIAEHLDISRNAVRTHIARLERDGLVAPHGVQESGGKPAQVYRATSEGEELLPKAYAPVLSGLIHVLQDRLGAERAQTIVREAGRRLAGPQPPAEGRDERVELALRSLREMGGVGAVEEMEGGIRIRGHSCPLAEVVQARPEVCGLVEAFLAELLGVPVRERCERGAGRERPHCAFEIELDGSS